MGLPCVLAQRHVDLCIAYGYETERQTGIADDHHQVDDIRDVTRLHRQTDTGRRVVADAEQRQRRHHNRVRPTAQHNQQCGAQLDAFVQLHGETDGKPAFQRYDAQREDGQVAGEHAEEAGRLTANT